MEVEVSSASDPFHSRRSVRFSVLGSGRLSQTFEDPSRATAKQDIQEVIYLREERREGSELKGQRSMFAGTSLLFLLSLLDKNFGEVPEWEE